MPQQSDFIAQIQVDENGAVICPFCERPLDGAAGVRYGSEVLHRACHEQLGIELGLQEGMPTETAQDEMAAFIAMGQERFS